MRRLTTLFSLLLLAVMSVWADQVVLSTPTASGWSHSDDNGIITIAEASGSGTPIQVGSGSFTLADESTATPMKLTGSKQFNLTYTTSTAITITKVTLYATVNKATTDTGTYTLGTSKNDKTSLCANLPKKTETPVQIDITNVASLYGSSQWNAVIVVEYTSTAPTLKVSPETLSLALNPDAPSKNAVFTLTARNLTDGTYDLTVPTVEGLSVTPTSFTVASGSCDQDFTVTYVSTADVAKAQATITATVGELTANVTVNYKSRATVYTQSTVSADATWDWSKLTETVELTDETTPNKTEEFLLANLDDRIEFTEDFGDPKAIKMETMQFPSRAGYAQGNIIKFKTSVAGTIAVDFCNTGKDRPYRYLNVNGVDTEFKSGTSEKVSAKGIAVPAGEVIIKGYIPNASDPVAREGDVVGDAMIRIYKIAFTSAETTTVYDFVNGDDLGLTYGTGGTADQQNAGDLAGKELKKGDVTMTFVNSPSIAVRTFNTSAKGNHFQIGTKNGKLRITAKEGRAITKIVVTQNLPESTTNFVKWEVDKGEGTLSEDKKTWEGNATSVRFNTTGATYINSIAVTTAPADEKTVTPAADEYTTEVSTLADLNALAAGTLVKLNLNNVIVTTEFANKLGYYIQDATGGTALYATGLTFNLNDVLNGYVYLNRADNGVINPGNRACMSEATNAANIQVTAGGSFTPVGGTKIDEVNVSGNLCKVVQLNNVKVAGTSKTKATVTDSEEKTIVINNPGNNFATSVYTEDMTSLSYDDATVVGVLIATTTANQIYPISIKDNGSTSIREINAAAAENVVIYNLQGARMNKLQKGLNIVNGKKVVIK